MGYFIRHEAGSEPRTHRGGGKAAVRALLKASVVGRTVQCSERRDALAWSGGQRGVVLGRCSSMGRCSGAGWCSGGAGGGVGAGLK